MFSVEFAIGRRSNSKPTAFAAQIEQCSRFATCDRAAAAIDVQVRVKHRSGRGRWARLMATLGIVPSASPQPDRSWPRRTQLREICRSDACEGDRKAACLMSSWNWTTSAA